jgi:hypothetical protein
MAAVFHQSVVLMAEMYEGSVSNGYIPWERQFSPRPETGLTLLNDGRIPRLLR